MRFDEGQGDDGGMTAAVGVQPDRALRHWHAARLHRLWRRPVKIRATACRASSMTDVPELPCACHV